MEIQKRMKKNPDLKESNTRKRTKLPPNFTFFCRTKKWTNMFGGIFRCRPLANTLSPNVLQKSWIVLRLRTLANIYVGPSLNLHRNICNQIFFGRLVEIWRAKRERTMPEKKYINKCTCAHIVKVTSWFGACLTILKIQQFYFFLLLKLKPKMIINKTVKYQASNSYFSIFSLRFWFVYF